MNFFRGWIPNHILTGCYGVKGAILSVVRKRVGVGLEWLLQADKRWKMDDSFAMFRDAAKASVLPLRFQGRLQIRLARVVRAFSGIGPA